MKHEKKQNLAVSFGKMGIGSLVERLVRSYPLEYIIRIVSNFLAPCCAFRKNHCKSEESPKVIPTSLSSSVTKGLATYALSGFDCYRDNANAQDTSRAKKE
jgi:hypothetical protein